MNLAEHISQINEENTNFRLTDDLEYWSECGVHTPEQLDRHLDIEFYINVYKDRHGIKPRWVDFDKLSAEQLCDLIAQL